MFDAEGNPMNARNLTSCLGGQWHGTYGMAPCPAHDDNNPSLSISDGDEGRVLWHCFAGCRQEAVRDALERGGLLQPKERQTDTSRPRSVIETTYDYCDPNGVLLFQVVRYRPKRFRQRRPDGKGGWIWDVKEVTRVPYRLPELLTSTDELVFVVEGEKDVDRARELRLTATCNPGGAGKWSAEYAQYFTDCVVAVVQDNDDPGRKHAELVASSLIHTAKEVRVLALPGLPPKGDLSDWIEAGGTAEELLRLAHLSERVALPTESPCEDWYVQCQTGARGQVLSNHANVMIALRSDPEWQGVFGFDEMRGQVMRFGPLPVAGAPVSKPTSRPEPWTDDNDAQTQESNLRHPGLGNWGSDPCRAWKTQFHPVARPCTGRGEDRTPRRLRRPGGSGRYGLKRHIQ